MDRFAPLRQFLNDLQFSHTSQKERMRDILLSCLPDVAPLGAVRAALDELDVFLPPLQLAAAAGHGEAVDLTLEMMHRAIDRLDAACSIGSGPSEIGGIARKVHRHNLGIG